MSNHYAIKDYNKETMARCVGMSLPVSTKQCIEICSFIKNRSLSEARDILNLVVEKKKAVPFTRFNWNMGHKTKIGPGRYPEKASKEIIKLLDSVEANAQFKGLNTANLFINHICAHKASMQWHYGRQRRTKMKRTNVEVVVEERVIKEGKKEMKKKGQKEAKK